MALKNFIDMCFNALIILLFNLQSLTKYSEQIKEIKQNCTWTENVDNHFCANMTAIAIWSLKSCDNLWGNSYTVFFMLDREMNSGGSRD